MLENNCDTSDSRCLLDENNGTHLQVTFGATTYPNQFLELHMMNLIILVKCLLFGIFESRRPVCNTSSKLFKFFFSFKKSPKMDFGGVMVTSLLGNLKCHFFSSFQKWHNYVATWPNPVNQPNVLLSIKWVYDSQTTKYWQNFCPICMISFSWPLKKTI